MATPENERAPTGANGRGAGAKLRGWALRNCTALEGPALALALLGLLLTGGAL